MNKIILENMKDYLDGQKEKVNDSHAELYIVTIVSYLNLLIKYCDKETEKK